MALAWALRVGPLLQTSKLRSEIISLPLTKIISLPLTTHPAIQDQQPLVGFADQSLNLGSRNARFQSHTHRLNFALLDPTPHGKRMQPQFMSCYMDPHHFWGLWPCCFLSSHTHESRG